MKKFLSVTLIICMLLSSCMMFASCSIMAQRSVDKNPTETLSDAVANAYADFFGDDVGIFEVVNKVSAKSSLQAYLESKDLLGEDVSRIGATLYTDLKNNSLVLDAEANYKNETLNARLFSNKNGFTVNGESIFGSDTSYKLTYKTFIDKFKDSDLAKEMGLEDEDIDEIIRVITELKEQMATSYSDNKDKVYSFGDEACKIFEQTVEKEEINIDGKKADTIAITYEITNDAIEAIAQLAYESFVADYDNDDMLENDLDETIEEFNNNCDIDLELKIYLNKKAEKLVKLEINGEVAVVENTYNWSTGTYEKTTTSCEVEFSLTFSETAVTIEGEVEHDGDKFSAEAVLEKKTEKKKVTYSLTVEVGEGSKYVDIIDAELEFNKDDKTFELSAELTDDIYDSNATKLKIKGTYEASKNKAALVINSVKFGTQSIKFTLGIVIDVKPDIPSTPKNAVDLIDLKKSEWEDLFEDIEKSDFAKMIAMFD